MHCPTGPKGCHERRVIFVIVKKKNILVNRDAYSLVFISCFTIAFDRRGSGISGLIASKPGWFTADRLVKKSSGVVYC